jgi:ABC-type molybdate transport system substrate-binding protein
MRPNTYEPIEYVAAIPRNALNLDEAGRFLNYLRSKQAGDIMQRNGLQQNF